METFVIGQDEIGTVRELVDRMAETQGDAVYLISPETGRVLTYAGIQKQSRAISARLQQAGLAPGDKVAFLSDNGLFTVQLFLGTMYGGLVIVPLNVRAGVTQLAYTLEHCDAKAVFVEDQYAALAREALANATRPVQVITTNVDAFATDDCTQYENIPIATPSADDIALLMYTSGSVGVPKAAIHSHRTVLAHGRNSRRSHQLTAADRSLLVLPIYHINAECVTLMPALFSGGSVVVPHHFNVSQFWDWLDEYRCTWSAIVPTIISQLLDWKDPHANRREACFERIRFIRSSSAPLSPSLQREFLDKFKLRLIQAMGSSEAGNIFSNPQAPDENKIGTPGLAWGFETRIIGLDGTDVAAGDSGEVLIRGAAVMQGYYKDPEGTAAVLDVEGWMHTGDLAYQDGDGYFFVIGRSRELIIKGGMNIAPRQIDEVLESHPAVLEAAAVGVPDHYLGEDLVAFAVLRSGMEGDEREMLAFCESRLGHFKTPTRIHFVADLPKGPSGKVQRLRLLSESGHQATAAPEHRNGQVANGVVPAGPTLEQTITQAWAEVLEQPRVDANINFFSLGGHSLTAIQCLARMREKLPVILSLSDFFENPTVAQQVALVSDRMSALGHHGDRVSAQQSSLVLEQVRVQRVAAPAGPQPIPARGRNLPYPLSSGQQRIWFFEELAPDVPLYNECEAVRLVGELRVEAIEQALNLVIARHEILRTTIQIAAERPIAIVHEKWTLRMKRIDLMGMAPAQLEAEVERLLIDEPRVPYHLDTEPGIRATLVRIGETEHVFILMMHHLVCDWASEGVLWRELSSAYRAISRSEAYSVDRLPVQYGDYAVWQQQRVTEEGFAADLAFWEENLRGAPELLELPSDRPRPRIQFFRGARQRFQIDGALTEALRNCSRQEKTSLFTVFAAALKTLLYRYTGSTDIPLGIPISDRERQELQSVIGFLLHTHVLRTDLSGDISFRELIARVQKGLVALYSHREVPFDQVVTMLRPERNLSHTPLFQVMIIWRDRDQQLSHIGLDGLVVESVLAETRTSKFDLTILVTDNESEISLEAEYNTDLFDEATIRRWLRQYATLLAGVAVEASQPISALPLLAEHERADLIAEWNRTEVDFPATTCVHQLVEEQVARTPDRVAVDYEGECLTFGELNRKADQLSAYLRQRGAKPGVLVGVMVERSLDLIIALFGVLKSGAAYVPLDPTYPAERLAFVLDDVKAPLLLTQERLTRNLPVSSAEVVCLDRDWNLIAGATTNAVQSAPAGPGDLAYVIYTSGSTGRPKGVEIPHRAVVNLLCSMRKKPGLNATDTLAAVTTLSFDIAVLELFLPLCVGAKLVIMSRDTASDGTLLLDRLIDARATVIQATPITFRLLIEAGWNGKPAMKVLCGGEALQRDLADQILARSATLWNMYGPTETTIWSSAIQVEPGDGPVPIGGPIDNTKFHILDAAGQLAPIGVAGELHIGGAGLARGYFKRPELTADKFIVNAIDGNRSARLYKTGDLVRRRANGTIEFLGRLDNQVKLRGFRIELGEIEAALGYHHGVGQCVVVVREDAAGDQQLVAYVVPLDRHAVPEVGELRELLKQRLPEYMVPAAFVMLDRMPLTPNGKIDRKALPAPALSSPSSAASYVAPRTSIEETLAEIWGRVLGLKQVGVHDDFFALGGHSLLAMRLIGEVRKSLSHRFSVAAFFQEPTIERMARVLHEEKSGGIEEAQNAFRVVLRRGAKSLAIIPEDDRLVALQTGEGRPPFFIVNSYPHFIDVVKQIGPDQPVMSLVGKEITQPSSYDIAVEAAAHVQTILGYMPHGPYMLGGCCAFGVVAYEIAQQLQELGHRVELLILFDAVNPYFMRQYSALRTRLAYHQAALKKMRWSEVPGWMAAKLAGLIARNSGGLGGTVAMDDDQARFAAQFGFSSERIAAVRKYRPRPYAGRLLLFKSHRPLGGRYRDERFGWGETVRGKIEACQLGTDNHLEIFKSESDRALVAQKVRSSLDEIASTLTAEDFGIARNSERRVG